MELTKTYKCEFCPKGYTRKYRLKQHKIKEHTRKAIAEVIYPCSIPENSPVHYKMKNPKKLKISPLTKDETETAKTKPEELKEKSKDTDTEKDKEQLGMDVDADLVEMFVQQAENNFEDQENATISLDEITVKDYVPFIYDVETTYGLSQFTCFKLSHHLHAKTLSKRCNNLKLSNRQIDHILELAETFQKGMVEFNKNNKVQIKEDLGELLIMKLSSPYKCIDIRQFWVVADQLFPSKTGVALTFMEFENFVKLLRYLKNNAII